ncbi:hypothetical protein EDD95_1639 [Streptomyces sp. CEV 2-1]|nr:hypothetical protein EDD95_1639 [Streptomyces sp. CEV 2-1]
MTTESPRWFTSSYSDNGDNGGNGGNGGNSLSRS